MKFIGKTFLWVVVVIAGAMPLNWIRLWIGGEGPQNATVSQIILATSICWGIAIPLGFLLIRNARRKKMLRAEEEKEIQIISAQPLIEISPTSALLKPGGKAYGAIHASLLKSQTVGYSAGTSGVSFRIAKGITIRSGAVRGKTIKGMVTVANGELVITDKRILFSGDAKSFEIPLGSLLNATGYSDGFGFSDNKTAYILKTPTGREKTIFGIILAKVLRVQSV